MLDRVTPQTTMSSLCRRPVRCRIKLNNHTVCVPTNFELESWLDKPDVTNTAIYILAKSATCELKASAPYQELVLLMTARKVKGLNIPTGLVNTYLTYSTFTKYVHNANYDYL